MSNQVTRIDGLEEVYYALKNLPSKLSAKVLLDANREVLKSTMLTPIRSSLPYSERTRKGIKVVPARGTKTGVYVGVSTDAFYLRFLQGGTEQRFTRTDEKSRQLSKRYKRVGRLGASKKHNRGQISARETGVVSTIDERINFVLEEITANYGEIVVKAITKYIKKYQKIG